MEGDQAQGDSYADGFFLPMYLNPQGNADQGAGDEQVKLPLRVPISSAFQHHFSHLKKIS